MKECVVKKAKKNVDLKDTAETEAAFTAAIGPCKAAHWQLNKITNIEAVCGDDGDWILWNTTSERPRAYQGVVGVQILGGTSPEVVVQYLRKILDWVENREWGLPFLATRGFVRTRFPHAEATAELPAENAPDVK
jgi:hypothetical protein